MAKNPSYPRREALQPLKRKAGLTSDRDEAQKDKVTGRDLQRKMENGPQKDREASEIVWVHLNSSNDNIIHLGGLPP